jgi:hypothetical protein
MAVVLRVYVAISILAFASALFVARWDSSMRRDSERALTPEQHRWVNRGLICASVNMFLAAVVLVSQASA